MPDLLTIVEQFRAAMERQDEAAIRRLVEVYGRSYKRLDNLVQSLAERIGNAAPTQGQVVRMMQYKALQEQMIEELTGIQAITRDMIAEQGMANVIAGERDAGRMVGAAITGEPIILPGFNRLNPEAITALLGFLSPEGELYKRIGELSGNAADYVTEKMLEGITLGYNPKKIALTFQDSYGRGLTDALRMVRTAQLYSYREANRASYTANSDVVKGWQYGATLDSLTCMSCVAQHGTFHKLDERLNGHYNCRCLTPGTLVSSPSIVAFEARRYDGEIISIRTVSGKFLSVTPNHPILTDKGWLPAYLIQEGDNVISNGGGDGASLAIDPDKNHVPARIEDIPTALKMDRFVLVPTSPQDFHGDGKGSDVHVISTNSLLLNNINSAIYKPFSKQVLSRRRMEGDFLASYGGLDTLLNSSLATSISTLGDTDASKKIIARSACNHKLVCDCLTTKINARHSEATINSASGHTAHFSQGIDTFAVDIAGGKFLDRDGYFDAFEVSNLTPDDFITGGLVTKQAASLEFIREALASKVKSASGTISTFALDISLDRVLEVNIATFSGHVYNLQTQEGIYNANSIITHNCAMIPVTDLFPPALSEEGKDWFAKQPEAVQRQMMGPGKYDAWKASKFDISQLSIEREDKVYGAMRGEAALKDLAGK